MNNKMKEIMTNNNIQNKLTIEQLLLTDWKNQFNPEQLYQINLGIQNGVDVSYYADPNYSYEQMFEIRLGLQKKLDVSCYTKPEYNDRQMEEIRKKLEKEEE